MTISVETTIGRASQLGIDGRMRSIPGLETGAIDGDAALAVRFIDSTQIGLSGAVAAVGWISMPYAATIIGCSLNVEVVPGTAAATFFVGKVGDTNYFLADYSIGTSHATGITELIADAAMVQTGIAKGDILVFGTNGNATSTGLAHVTLTVVPA